MAARLTQLEALVRLAEDAAFEQEARAAALEVELFRSMDEDHVRALAEVGVTCSVLDVCCTSR